MPWLYVRDVLARRYRVAPFEIDDWPHNEVEIALALVDLEGEAAEHHAARNRPRQ